MNLRTLDAKDAAKLGLKADFVNGSLDTLSFTTISFTTDKGTFHVRMRSYSISLCQEEKLTEKVYVVKGEGIYKEFKQEHEAKAFKSRYEFEDAPLELTEVDKEIVPEVEEAKTISTEEIPF